MSADLPGSISGIERAVAALLLAGAAAGAISLPGFLATREAPIPLASAVPGQATTVVHAAPLPKSNRIQLRPSGAQAVTAAPRGVTPVQAHVTKPVASPPATHVTPPAVAPDTTPPSAPATIASVQVAAPVAATPVAAAAPIPPVGTEQGKGKGHPQKPSAPAQAQPAAAAAAAGQPSDNGKGNGNGNGNGNGSGSGNGHGHNKGSA